MIDLENNFFFDLGIYDDFNLQKSIVVLTISKLFKKEKKNEKSLA